MSPLATANRDWPQARFRYLASVQKGLSPSSRIASRADLELLPYLTMEYLRGDSNGVNLVPAEPSLVVARTDSILLLWDGSNAGEFLRAKRGIVSSTSALVTPRGIDRDFFYWACKANESEIKANTVGMGIPHVNPDILANVTIRLPPSSQQRAIADYLNREIAQLDALIESKNRVLALLAEKYQALATQAVTRGIVPGAPHRDSGVSWIGEVPANWEIKRSRWLLTERDTRSTTGAEELLTVSHLTGVTPRTQKHVHMFEAETTEGYKICLQGDLVINTLWAWMGAMGVAPSNGIVSPSYHVYELATPRLSPGYVDALVRLTLFAQEARRYSKGVWSSRLRLYPEGFFQIFLPVPPKLEQRTILSFLQEKRCQLDNLGTKVKQAISLLGERRAALIAAAVSGQIDTESMQ